MLRTHCLASISAACLQYCIVCNERHHSCVHIFAHCQLPHGIVTISRAGLNGQQQLGSKTLQFGRTLLACPRIFALRIFALGIFALLDLWKDGGQWCSLRWSRSPNTICSRYWMLQLKPEQGLFLTEFTSPDLPSTICLKAPWSQLNMNPTHFICRLQTNHCHILSALAIENASARKLVARLQRNVLNVDIRVGLIVEVPWRSDSN
mmetsp:Transcript_107102/g.189403  ORF Transcript_107102/g.189403 Transcript_107102/m.189403 type:complete len:206 (-) Transcript_107102:398-1015(-)